MRYFLLDNLTPIVIEPNVCKCGSREFKDVPIHSGQSISRDCARCGKFVMFLKWYGKASARPCRYREVKSADVASGSHTYGDFVDAKLTPDRVREISGDDLAAILSAGPLKDF